MTLAEVLKSGRKIRRRSSESQLFLDPSGKFWHRAEIIATDWEVEPEPEQRFSISMNELEAAWISCSKDNELNHSCGISWWQLAKKLGFNLNG